jgi:hypothetical protein
MVHCYLILLEAEMKSEYFIIMALLLLISTGVVEAAKIPPPVSTRCRISCVVEQKAEWKTLQPEQDLLNTEQQVQAEAMNPTLIINSAHESSLEIDSNGQFHSGTLPIEIITSIEIQQNKPLPIKTLTACWKM